MRHGLGGGLTLTLVVMLGGVLLPVRAEAQDFQVLHNFGAPGDGVGPSGPLVLDSTGNLYGATSGGPGEYGYGTVFELSPSGGSWQEAILYASPSANGYPWGPLIFDRAGNLYGTTVGGPISDSEAFELSPTAAGWSYIILYDQGAGPGLAINPAGELYGPIGPGDYFGIGAIGMLMPGLNGWTYTDLANFDPSVGYDPPAPPIPDGRGGLIGVTTYGGINNQLICTDSRGCGVIFDMTPAAQSTFWDYRVLHKFASFATDGQFPFGGLVMNAAGAIYGTTGNGGPNQNGAIFKLTPSVGQTGVNWGMTFLYSFPDCNIGCQPGGPLVFDKAGNLYGVGGGGVQVCGGFACGTVYRLSPQPGGTWKYTLLHAFTLTDGAGPWGVVLDGKGNLFGVTGSGGTYDAGVAFEITQ